MKTNRTALIACLASIAIAAIANAQSFDVSWHSIDGGGALGQGGNYQLTSTIGQPDAGVALMGGPYSIRGGFLAFLPGTPLPCPGDVNDDGAVNLTDLSTLLANFGVASGATQTQGDLDADTDVDLTDLATLLANFGTTC